MSGVTEFLVRTITQLHNENMMIIELLSQKNGKEITEHFDDAFKQIVNDSFKDKEKDDE